MEEGVRLQPQYVNMPIQRNFDNRKNKEDIEKYIFGSFPG